MGKEERGGRGRGVKGKGEGPIMFGWGRGEVGVWILDYLRKLKRGMKDPTVVGQSSLGINCI